MTDETDRGSIDLTRRRALTALGTIGAASAAAGAGTFALFSDEESTNTNTVSAGTLNLAVGGSGTKSLNVSNIAPGDSETTTVEVTNDGSLEGSLDLVLSQANVSRKSPEPQQALSDVRTFTAAKGYDQRGNGPIDLSDDVGLSNAQLDVDMSDDPYEFNITVPKEFSQWNEHDNLALSFDLNDSGEPDYQVIYQNGAWSYKLYDNGWQSKQSGTPSNVGANSPSGNMVSIRVDASELDNPFAIGGNVRLPSENPPTSGTNLIVYLTPNFSWAWESDTYVQIEQGRLRDLGDLLDLEISLSGGGSSQTIARGKASRITGEEYDSNWTLPDDTSHNLGISYELSPNVGNAVQGESVAFDATVELNQEDPQ